MGYVQKTWIGLLVLHSCASVFGETLYMDSKTVCGTTRNVGLNSIMVEPRGPGGVSNPPANCVLYLESAFQESFYEFEIVIEAAAFVDCGLTLNIFNGNGVGGSYIRQLGCGSQSGSTGQFYSSERAITLQMIRSRDQYILGSHFTLSIKTYKNENAALEYLGTYRLSVGAIVGIVLGVVVLIAFAILLGWCYKTGRLGFGDDYPSATRKSGVHDDMTTEGNENGTFVSWNMKRDADKLSVTTASRSNFDLADPRMWDSLTATSDNKGSSHDNVRNLKSGDTGGRSVNDDYYNTSPGSRVRGRRDDTQGRRDREDTQGKRGREDNYENVDYNRNERDGRGRGGSSNQTKDGRKGKETAGLFENPDKEGYLYDYEHVKSLSGDGKQDDAQKTADFATELKNAINRNSLKREQSSDSDAPGAPTSATVAADVHGQATDTDVSSGDNLLTGKHSGPDAHSSPKTNKKLKRKSSKERKSPKSSRKHDAIDISNSPNSKNQTVDEDNVPPEAYAPIFSEEETTSMPSYVPPHQYQPGYQDGYPPAPYGAGYPMGAYPYPGVHAGPPGAPFQQAGQAQYDSLQAQYGDVNHPGMPGYMSTPYNQYGAPGQAGNNQALVATGTVLDDPRVPPPGTSLVRYDDDPLTGMKTSQVIWTDAKRDPTDPPPEDSNPQITRKTVTRVTTKSADDNIADAPNPRLQDMTLRTAQQIQASGAEPAFMSPSHGAVHHPGVAAIQYTSPTPETGSSTFYTPHRPPYVQTITGSPTPVIHEAPNRNVHIRDHIVMSNVED